MAIQAKITTIQGVTLEKSYINISNPQIQKVKTEEGNKYILGANACVYANKQACIDNKPPVEGFSVTCDLDLSKNVIDQAYVALKTNERLSNIVDC